MGPISDSILFRKKNRHQAVAALRSNGTYLLIKDDRFIIIYPKLLPQQERHWS
jgi:hypothetical protein